MSLKILLAKQKKALVQTWVDQAFQTYPARTCQRLSCQADPFANPVGDTFRSALAALMDLLLEGMDAEKAAALLAPVVRIRAVQDFSPSQATAFIFSLKAIILAHVGRELPEALADRQMIHELLALEAEIDRMGLVGFDTYMACKEKIYRLKADNLASRTLKTFQRAGLIRNLPEQESDVRMPRVNA